ncbi:MAG TPA: iron-containing alcohol dehydrogenase [Hyphomicrobiaceae bacterium]|nr:iron-containing alcohol dehydrogenase [Hyphomicrobiaceae bacterium]
MSDTTAGLKAGTFSVTAHDRVIFGTPAGEAVLAEAERYGARRIFVTSTRSLAQKNDGPLQRLERALGALHVGTYAAIKSHSPREDVVAGANAARAAKADLLVAVGGGSVIDATKAMQLCLWMGIETPDAMEPYCVGFERTKLSPVTAPADAVRMISVSTTLSASEFTENAGITQSKTNTKQSFKHRLFAPRTVVLDPAATLDTPDWLLFCTGIRSVDHAVENYCNERASLATEALSLQGLKLLSRALPAIKRSPSDLAPRLEAQIGMWQAIAPSASGVPTGASHGIGYALGATFGVPHGHTSCVMLPAVLKWNAAVNGERQKALAEAMGAPGRPTSDLVKELIAGLDQPVTLRGVGIKRENLDEIARRALAYHPVQVNPRPIKTEADVMEILELAW